MEKNIAVIWGDCSSPEIVKQTIRVLDKVAEKYGHTFHYTDAAMGGEAIDKYGDPLPQHELDKCLAADSVLLGAVGGPKWEGLPGEQRPEKGLLRLRASMGLYSNNRPAKIWPQLAPASPLKPEIVAQGIDFIIVRELIGGVYFGNHETHTLENGEKQAIDSMPYSEHEIERIGRIGFETAQKRRKKLCCVDKANVLDTSRLWRSVMHRLQAEYPDVEYSEMFVDNCAMQIVKNPAQFDVIVTENMFGDILSDEASMITGSIGMIPSSSLGDGTRGLYEPIHGSAPDIAGKDIVNPTACILSAAMMLRRRAYFDGRTDWLDVTENSVRSTAWSNGLAHSFTYREMQVAYATLPSNHQEKTQLLIQLLAQHPEGIVLYDRTQPHAVLLTDYTNGVFYCSDPAGNISSGRIPLTSSSVSIAQASCYWYVSADHNGAALQADDLRLEGMRYPVNVHTGSGMALTGTANSTSGSTLEGVQVAILDENDKIVQSAQAQVGGTSFSLKTLDDQIHFGELPTGCYTYMVIVTETSGENLCFASDFTVSDAATSTAIYWSVQDPDGTKLTDQTITATAEETIQSTLGWLSGLFG